MNIHEYQAKGLFKDYGIAVPKGIIAETPQQAREAAQSLGGEAWVVKAQVHTGGRGKAGGVKLARTLDDVVSYADDIIGMTLITKQTGAEGKKVHSVWIEETSNIESELYFSVVTDRETAKLAFIASAEGGMDIEELAESSPEKIHTVFVDVNTGMRGFHVAALARALGLPKEKRKELAKVCVGLFNLYVEKDCSMIEINPLVVTKEGDLIALDGKLGFDENALFRHPDVLALRDEREEEAREREAANEGFSYVSLDGTIGCMVNGAGLAMATMDITKSFGGAPANFLDVGGSATVEKVTIAFKIILSDPNVKAILVNIFGGIMKCDIVAEGIIEAARQLAIAVPLVVRLEGTNVEKGKEILAASDLNVIAANSFADAAEKAVNAAKS